MPLQGFENDSIYSLDDLQAWKSEGVSLAVLGHPIAHSVSPAMHNAALAEMAKADERFASWRYHKFDIPPERLPEALPLLHAKGFRGINLTIPHKIQALDLCAAVDPVAKRMGAVNTLLWREDGYHGFNSDGYGLEMALREAFDITLPKIELVLLGAGGAGRASAVHCLERGCQKLWFGNRSAAKLETVLNVLPEAHRKRVRTFDLDTPPPLGEGGEVAVVNATSLGLRSGDPAPTPIVGYPHTCRVYDMIYNPPETRLLREAKEAGMKTANGLSMLVWQGVRSLEIWSDALVPADAMKEAIGATR